MIGWDKRCFIIDISEMCMVVVVFELCLCLKCLLPSLCIHIHKCRVSWTEMTPQSWNRPSDVTLAFPLIQFLWAEMIFSYMSLSFDVESFRKGFIGCIQCGSNHLVSQLYPDKTFTTCFNSCNEMHLQLSRLNLIAVSCVKWKSAHYIWSPSSCNVLHFHLLHQLIA